MRLTDESEIRNAINDAIASKPETISKARVMSYPPGALEISSASAQTGRASKTVIKIEIKRQIDILICFVILTPFERSSLIFFRTFKSTDERFVRFGICH